jgi:hypothetical protein
MYISLVHEQKAEINHNQNRTGKNTMKIEKPNRVTHTYEQTLNGTIKDIMIKCLPAFAQQQTDTCANSKEPLS